MDKKTTDRIGRNECVIDGNPTTKADRAAHAAVIASGLPDVFGGPLCIRCRNGQR